MNGVITIMAFAFVLDLSGQSQEQMMTSMYIAESNNRIIYENSDEFISKEDETTIKNNIQFVEEKYDSF